MENLQPTALDVTLNDEITSNLSETILKLLIKLAKARSCLKQDIFLDFTYSLIKYAGLTAC